MSRIGKKAIKLPAGVSVTREDRLVKVSGPKGELSAVLPPGIDFIQEENAVSVQRIEDNRLGRSAHGLARTLVNNMVVGVSKGFEKGLEISGVGYRAELNNDVLKLVVGFSTPREYVVPKGVAVKIEKQVNILVSGIDKYLVGKVASEIRDLRKPEPYKGKGIKYAGEQVRRKVGKSVGTK
ncbi:MAG TPA: 50S ribosomal protein L6 [Syntrophales bacterium]|jgi:large subunit ribosomal protein L6|nr:50S ribosomal protein L6 [Syntrophales bacterium]HON22766.1 50S ribosomal protein L6 [Syntrophales bacterium]HPC32177.1 50S ribosomal protein L6 [Syntrophales bacterium]HQJ31544.1 50S ribosomal protein L6 [Syntrophales bacterium]HRU88111.1 50S ribosomal protein L6 [Syntrophales bacterium]